MKVAHCGECKMDFCKISNLRAHVKRKHPDKLDIIAPITRIPSGLGNYPCIECNKCFTNFGNLRFHVKQKHSDKLEELASYIKKNYKCDQCDGQFNLLKQFIKHRSTHRNINKTKKCSLCHYTGASPDILIHHYTEDHGLKIENETLEFDSVEAFQAWKTKIEAETFSSFVQTCGVKKSLKHTKTMYFCHRSGNIRTRGKNIRKPKSQGSNKIGGFCPARMTVFTSSEKSKVQFCGSHVGHGQEEDLEHLFLTKSQRENITADIATEMPLQIILDESRDSDESSNVEHIHLLTKKDLYNIKDSFHLKGSSVHQANDDINTEPLVNEGDNVQQQVDERRKKLLQFVQEELLHATSLGEIEAAEKILAPLKPTLAAVKCVQESTTSLTMPSSSKTCHNKNIQPQRRLIATKSRKNGDTKKAFS